MTTAAAPTGLAFQLARVTAPLTRAIAGRRFFPLWAVVHHRGRVSGRELSVPVAVIVTDDEFIVGLPWGVGTNWVRNALAAKDCVVTWKGADHRIDAPQILDRAGARLHYSKLTWAVSQRLFRADSFLLLRRSR